MIIKTINLQDSTEENKKDIMKLMDVFLKPKGRPPVDGKNIEKALGEPNNTSVVACDGKKIVGIITLIEANLFTARIGIIDEVVVDENYRGKGVASKIMEEILKIAKERKLDLLKVDTNADNPSNRLYQKFGFIKRNDNIYKLFI